MNLFRVLSLITLPTLVGKNLHDSVVSFAMVSTCDGGNKGGWSGCVCPYSKEMGHTGHTQENYFSLHGFLDKTIDASNLSRLNPRFPMKGTMNS